MPQSGPRSEPLPVSDRNDSKRVKALDDFAARLAVPRQRQAVESTATEVLEQLERAGVRVLVLKGPVLARLLYRSGEERGYNDLDLLIDPEQRGSADEALASQGLERVADRGVDDFLGVLHAGTWLDRTRHVAIDLHWRLAGCSVEPKEAWRKLYHGRGEIEFAGRTRSVLGRPGLALHLATHAAQHGQRDLKAMADLTRGIERWPLEDWRAAAELAAELGATAAFAAGLRLQAEGAELAKTLLLPTSDKLSWEIQHRASRPRGTFHLEALAHAQGLRERAVVLRRSLLPARAWIAWEYRVAPTTTRRLLVAYGRHLSRSPTWAWRAWRWWRQAKRAETPD